MVRSMTIVTYTFRRRRQATKKRAAALAVPVISNA